MNDRFMFKFYSSSFKKIFDVIQINISTLTITIVDENKCPLCFNLSDGVLIQCTGLKDKNGKLICEGDIVKFNYDTDEIIAVVSWDDNEGQIGYYLNTTDYFKDKYVTDYDFYKNDYEILGNIYENPELLKECKDD